MSGKEFAYSGRKTVNNAVVFAVGKVFSAVATLFWLGLVVRLLGVGEYAKYVAAIAVLETSIVAAAIGLDWMVVRYVPELYVKDQTVGLRKFIFQAALLRFLAASALSIILLLASHFLSVGDVKAAVALRENALSIAGLLVFESLLRIVRDNALESLGEQRLTQFGVLLRTLLLIAMVLATSTLGAQLDAVLVLRLELTASVLTFAYAAFALVAKIKSIEKTVAVDRLNPKPTEENMPRVGACFRLGLQNYASTIISYAVSTQVLILVASIFSDAARLAQFGLICRLFDIARGYVPALMLMSVLRPRFVGIFSISKSFERVATEASLANRLSILTVAPIVGVITLYGDLIVAAVSGGRIESGGYWVAALIVTLLLRVRRQISVVLVNCVELSSILLRISLLGLSGWIVAWWLFASDAPALGALILISIDELVWLFAMAFALRTRGYEWPAGLSQIAIALVGVVPCVALGLWLEFNLREAINMVWFRAAGVSAVIVIAYIPLARFAGLWSLSEVFEFKTVLRR